MNLKHTSTITRALSFALAFAPALAQAHPGGHHVTGFTAGATHPLLGLDHLLAMIAVGLWATQLKGRATWVIPAAFVAVMSAGGLLASNGMILGGAEVGIVASVLTLGVLVAGSVRLPLAASVALVSTFAFFHGQAHGAEMPANATALTYAAGFALTTAMLHAAGIGAALLLREAVAVRAVGATVAVCAGLMMLGVL